MNLTDVVVHVRSGSGSGDGEGGEKNFKVK